MMIYVTVQNVARIIKRKPNEIIKGDFMADLNEQWQQLIDEKRREEEQVTLRIRSEMDALINSAASTRETKTANHSVLKGAVVGGIIAGPAGAIVGAIIQKDKNDRSK